MFALAVANLAPWNEVADLITDLGSALAIVDRRVSGIDRADPEVVELLASAVTRSHVERAEQELDELLRNDPVLSFHTVLDDTYPTNLRDVYDRPPFVFIRGALVSADEDAIAVVGTRRPSPEGREQARWLATELARRAVTVVSGLAAGIDTEAHNAALDSGGRTIAVMGTGITRVYPAENVDLAARIAAGGALVSQFAPTAPPRSQNFPIRNRVTSGIAVGTAVIEASSTSGAKMQARLALEHGKRLFLVESLMTEKWARDYALRPGAVVVSDVEQIISIIECRPARVEQLKLV